MGYFAQHQLEQLDLAASPLQHLKRLSPNVPELQLRKFLGGFDFQGDMATDPVGPRSGGEKARLVLALLAWQAPNILLLDEPTNHLDLEMRHALTVALQDYEGAVITVSHDRHLLENTVERFLLVADGEVREFDGDLDDYRRWLDQRRLREKAESAPQETSINRKAARKAAAEQRAALQPLRDKSKRLMNEIDARTKALQDIEQELADPSMYQPENKDKLQPLLIRQAKLREEIEAMELEWAEVEEELEARQRG